MMDHHRHCMPAVQAMTATNPTIRRCRVAIWLLIGLLIVAHGCHAGRDTELRARPGARDKIDTPVQTRR
jgi:hypothetical protein